MPHPKARYRLCHDMFFCPVHRTGRQLMASIAVVGAGFAGMSAAARLAKLGHDVTIFDAASAPGGRLNPIEIDDTLWQASPMAVTLPGVFRDLFRKSGRPMSAALDLVPAEPRRHYFFDRKGPIELNLPTGTRSAQHEVIAELFGKDAWSPWVDGLVDDWDTARRFIFEKVTTADDISALEGRFSARPAHKGLKNRHLENMALDRLRFLGADPKLTPAAWNIWHYVERNFGRWRFEDDLAGLSNALVKRLGERKVTLELDTPVLGVTMKLGRVVGIKTAAGAIDADHTVWASGHSLPGLSEPRVERLELVYTGVELSGYELPRSVMVHGGHNLRAWDSGPNRWVALAAKGTNVMRVLRRIGVPKEAVTKLVEFKPPQYQIREAETFGSGLNLDFKNESRDGKKNLGARLPRPAISPAPGLFVVGGTAVTGASLELTGMGTAAVAQAIGPAPRGVTLADD